MMLRRRLLATQLLQLLHCSTKIKQARIYCSMGRNTALGSSDLWDTNHLSKQLQQAFPHLAT
jgi:hypothetical protein